MSTIHARATLLRTAYRLHPEMDVPASLRFGVASLLRRVGGRSRRNLDPPSSLPVLLSTETPTSQHLSLDSTTRYSLPPSNPPTLPPSHHRTAVRPTGTPRPLPRRTCLKNTKRVRRLAQQPYEPTFSGFLVLVLTTSLAPMPLLFSPPLLLLANTQLARKTSRCQSKNAQVNL